MSKKYELALFATMFAIVFTALSYLDVKSRYAAIVRSYNSSFSVCSRI